MHIFWVNKILEPVFFYLHLQLVSDFICSNKWRQLRKKRNKKNVCYSPKSKCIVTILKFHVHPLTVNILITSKFLRITRHV